MKKLNLSVKGMTCSSCEVLIERGLKKVPGVEKVHVRRARESAEVECADQVTLEQLQDAVKDKGYMLSFSYAAPEYTSGSSGNSFISAGRERWSEIGSVAVILIGAYIILSQLNLIPESLGLTENMSYGFIFVIGLVAATSTCLAVAGGLLLAVAGKYNEKYPHLTGWQKFRPHISFNIGRILSYTLLGGLVGLLGSTLAITPKITGAITIAASVLMIIVGIQLLQIFPWLNKVQIKMPKFIAHKVYDASAQAPSTKSSFLFGASTFFLPCGFTQALQLYALGTGSFLTGALTMLAFSLGTLPSLAGIGAVSSFTKGDFKRYFTTFSAILVIFLGFYNIPNGLALTGASVSFGNNAPSQLAEDINIIGGKQIISMKVDYLDYVPSRFTIVEGVPVEWHIDGSKAVGCARVISVPSLGITEYLPQDREKVITFTPQKSGTITFSCTMGMAGPGAFTVVPNTQGIKPAQLEGPLQAAPAAAGANTALAEGSKVQKLSMEISRERGFYPNTFTIKKGIPVEVEIDAKIPLRGCMSTLVIPKYNVAHLLSLGKSTLRFTPTEGGTFPFTCSMGSKIGEFIVV